MQNNKSIMQANLTALEFVATKLGEIRNNVVFLGGCTTGLFITDPDSIPCAAATASWATPSIASY